jgi:predicted nucleotidyltransferase
MKSDDEQLYEIVRRIVEAVHPLRVILFGSTARGEAGPQSDFDMLIVVPDGTHRFETTQAVYRHLRGLRVGVDVVVATESDVREYGNSPVLIYREALRDGRELYAA